jgi:hypothetical protein
MVCVQHEDRNVYEIIVNVTGQTVIAEKSIF